MHTRKTQCLDILTLNTQQQIFSLWSVFLLDNHHVIRNSQYHILMEHAWFRPNTVVKKKCATITLILLAPREVWKFHQNEMSHRKWKKDCFCQATTFPIWSSVLYVTMWLQSTISLVCYFLSIFLQVIYQSSFTFGNTTVTRGLWKSRRVQQL